MDRHPLDLERHQIKSFIDIISEISTMYVTTIFKYILKKGNGSVK